MKEMHTKTNKQQKENFDFREKEVGPTKRKETNNEKLSANIKIKQNSKRRRRHAKRSK